jgi:hypothetical protein
MSLTDAEYRAHPGVNYSTLKHMRKSPLHYRHAVDNPEDNANDYAMLRAVHALVLEPMSAHDQIAVWEGRRDKRDKAYVAFLEQSEGKNVLTPTEYEQALQIANAYGRNRWLRWVLSLPQTVCEEPVVWNFDLGDALLLCKGKPDIMHYTPEHGLIVADIKTFGDTTAELIAWAARKYGWMLQLAHYTYAAAKHYSIDLNAVQIRWYTVVAEDKAPWDATAVEWDQGIIAGAVADHMALLQKVVACMRADEWPGRGDVQAATLPTGMQDG